MFLLFDDKCMRLFKPKGITAPIMTSPNWNLLCELICDASDHVVMIVLGNRHD
jgi:hypothetical protein